MMERRPKRPLSAQYLKNVYFPNGVLEELKEETTTSLEKHTHTLILGDGWLVCVKALKAPCA